MFASAVFKFIFTRCVEPQAPDWATNGLAHPDWSSVSSESAMAPVLQSLWEWQSGVGSRALPTAGNRCSAIQQAAASATMLAPPRNGDDAVRIGAAYRCGYGDCNPEHTRAYIITNALNYHSCMVWNVG